MKIEVLQEQLIKGLAVIERAVATRAQLPVLSHFLMEAKNEGLVLSATDLEIGVRVLVVAKVIEPGIVVIPAKMFSEFLSSLSPGKVEIKLEKETLVIVANTYSAKFQTIAAEEFPKLPEVKGESELGKLETKDLVRGVERVIFACARDSLRPVLTGGLWEIGKGKLRLVATDGFRLGIEEVMIEGAEKELSILVPARVVAEVVRLATEGQIVVGHLPTTNQIYFKIGDTLVVSQLLEGNFPDYTKIIPKEFTSELTVAKDELLQAVRTTHIFARDNSNMVKWYVGEGKLKLVAVSPERGECNAEIPIHLTGEPGEIIFNAKFVLDYLGVVAGEKVWLGMGGKLAPGMFRDPGQKSGQYVVMPINA